jgi:hypothetical protein
VPFDVNTFAQAGGRLDVSDLGLCSAFESLPLKADDLRCLGYMHDIEHHTVCYLRDLLVTRAHSDPSITTFLTIWNYEEHWHGAALADVLAAHGERSGLDRVAAVRSAADRRQRLRPLAFMVGSAVFADLPAVALSGEPSTSGPRRPGMPGLLPAPGIRS